MRRGTEIERVKRGRQTDAQTYREREREREREKRGGGGSR